MGAVEQPLAGDAGQIPAQLGNLGQVGLAVEEHPLGVEPGRQPAGRDLQRRAADALGLGALDEPVQVGQEEEALDPGIPAGSDGRPDRPGIVAQVRAAGGGDAGEDTGQGRRGCGHDGRR